MFKRTISIGCKKVGEGHPVFIIAEAGVNHNGKLSLAKKLIDAAVTAGADAVKFQTFDPDMLVTKEAKKAEYQVRNETNPSTSQTRVLSLKNGESESGETQYEMLRRLMLPRECHQELKEYAEKNGIIFLSTPFSLGDAEFLRKLGVPAIKVGSSDTNNIPFLKTIADWGLPIILSTGMSDIAMVRDAVEAIRMAGNEDLILLHCTTNYPTPFSEANLRAIQTLQKEFSVPVGFSDHTEGIVAPVFSVALGAVLIEKHLTLDKDMDGPDHKASLNPKEFKELVRAVRSAELALGTGKKSVFGSEKEIANVARKSIVTSRFVKKGELFTEENLTTKRPGTGLPPKEFDKIIGTRAARDIAHALPELTRSRYPHPRRHWCGEAAERPAEIVRKILPSREGVSA